MTLDKFLYEQTFQHRRPNMIKNHRIYPTYLDRYKSLDSCTCDDLKAFTEKYINDFEKKRGQEATERDFKFYLNY